MALQTFHSLKNQPKGTLPPTSSATHFSTLTRPYLHQHFKQTTSSQVILHPPSLSLITSNKFITSTFNIWLFLLDLITNDYSKDYFNDNLLTNEKTSLCSSPLSSGLSSLSSSLNSSIISGTSCLSNQPSEADSLLSRSSSIDSLLDSEIKNGLTCSPGPIENRNKSQNFQLSNQIVQKLNVLKQSQVGDRDGLKKK